LAGVHEGEVNGWRSLHLESDSVAVTVLPDKGADIYALVDAKTGVDALFKAEWGLQPPGAPARPGSGDAAFLKNYEGGWQELFPNTNDAANYRGTILPFHGEVATLPWTWSRMASTSADEITVRLEVECQLTPFRIERTMRLRDGERRLVLDERITNLSASEAHFTWGHHCVLGPPLVAEGARLDVACQTVVTPPQPWEETARLVPGQRSHWPIAACRDGSTADLSRVPGPDAGSHDDVFLTDLASGWAAVVNPALGLGFRLEWDPAIFRWVVSWQPYGGARAMPLRGAYGLGIEPWTSGGNLEDALAKGAALAVSGRGSIETTVTATFTDG
jgi:galactose mutarotase-like enzyme